VGERQRQATSMCPSHDDDGTPRFSLSTIHSIAKETIHLVVYVEEHLSTAPQCSSHTVCCICRGASALLLSAPRTQCAPRTP
jgi:hypothetical protein